MNKQEVQYLMSKPVYSRLSKTLLAIDMAETENERDQIYEKLREQLSKLFSLKHVGQYPNQVMEDFAEVVQGLYVEKDDLDNYTFHIKEYLHERIRNHRKKSDILAKRARFADKKSNMSELEHLDISYKAWVYTHGYHRQQRDMYEFLLSILEQVLFYYGARTK